MTIPDAEGDPVTDRPEHAATRTRTDDEAAALTPKPRREPPDMSEEAIAERRRDYLALTAQRNADYIAGRAARRSAERRT